MKIKINENETYEIKVPEEIDGRELFTFKSRIDHILKLVGRDPLIQTAQDKPLTPIERNPHAPIEQRPWDKDRNEAIKLAKTHYFGIDEEKKAYEQLTHKTWLAVSKNVSPSKMKWQIKPEEIGLTRWPAMGEMTKFGNVNHLKIQNETKTEEIPEEKV